MKEENRIKARSLAPLKYIFDTITKPVTSPTDVREVKAGPLELFRTSGLEFKDSPTPYSAHLIKRGDDHLSGRYTLELKNKKGHTETVIPLNRDTLAAITLATQKKQKLIGRSALTACLVLLIRESSHKSENQFDMYAFRRSGRGSDENTIPLEQWRDQIRQCIFPRNYNDQYLLKDMNNCSYKVHSTTEFITLIPDDPACISLQDLRQKTRILNKVDLREVVCPDNYNVRIELDDESFSENFTIMTGGSNRMHLIRELQYARSVYRSRDCHHPLPDIPRVSPTLPSRMKHPLPMRSPPKQRSPPVINSPSSIPTMDSFPSMSSAPVSSSSQSILIMEQRMCRPPNPIPRTPSPSPMQSPKPPRLVHKTPSLDKSYVNVDHHRSNSDPTLTSSSTLPRIINKTPKPAPRKKNSSDSGSERSLTDSLIIPVPAPPSPAPVRPPRLRLQRQDHMIDDYWSMAGIDVQRDKDMLDVYRQDRIKKRSESLKNSRLVDFMDRYYINGEIYTQPPMDRENMTDEEDIYSDVRTCRLPPQEEVRETSPPTPDMESAETTLYDILFRQELQSPDPFNLAPYERSVFCIRLHLLDASNIDGGWQEFAERVMRISCDELSMMDSFGAFHNYPVLEIVLRHWHMLFERKSDKIKVPPSKDNIIWVLKTMNKISLLEVLGWRD